jgi:hypothetical protein
MWRQEDFVWQSGSGFGVICRQKFGENGQKVAALWPRKLIAIFGLYAQ